MRLANHLLPPGSLRRRFVGALLREPAAASGAIARTVIASYRLTGRVYPLSVVVGPHQRVHITRHPTARATVKAPVIVWGWGGSYLPSSIHLSERSTVSIGGKFELGPNVHISIGKGGRLDVGGQRVSSGSGVTCDTRIMVERSVRIGQDVIVAWDVLITDSDWHHIDGVSRQSDVIIGDHVWIAHGASVLKGAVIPEDTVVASKSLVSSAFHGRGLLLAGVPARIARTGVRWVR